MTTTHLTRTRLAAALAARATYLPATPLAAATVRTVIARALASPYTWSGPLPPQGGPELAEPPSLSQVSRAPGVALPAATVVALHRCWQRGDSTRATADTCQVSQTTVRRYFDRFKTANPTPT